MKVKLLVKKEASVLKLQGAETLLSPPRLRTGAREAVQGSVQGGLLHLQMELHDETQGRQSMATNNLQGDGRFKSS